MPSAEKLTEFVAWVTQHLKGDEKGEAQIAAGILNSKPCLEYLQSLVFPGTKRPRTVELLQRLDLDAIAKETDRAAAWRASRTTTYTQATDPVQRHLVMERYSVRRPSTE